VNLKRAIRNSAGSILATALLAFGSAGRAKKTAFQKDVITSIALHNPRKDIFSKIVRWLLQNGFTFISTAMLIDILNGQAPCPKGAVWISLDDGWKENLDNVIPVAVQYDIPITIFVYTAAIEEGAFWWKKLRQSADLLPAEYRDSFSISTQPESVRKEVIELIARTGLKFEREAMTVEDIRNIATIPQVTLGAHTVTHPFLPQCPESQIEYEIAESGRKLEEWTGCKATAFAYPNGLLDGRERQYLERYGYQLAGTTECKFARAGTDVYLFPRNIVMDDGSFSENLCHALGIWDPLIRRLKIYYHKPCL